VDRPLLGQAGPCVRKGDVGWLGRARMHSRVSGQGQIEIRKLFLISKYFYNELTNLYSNQI
jgi:hypothetical protein